MVARISAGKSISRMLNYNEKKVQQSKAELIDAVHFGKELKDLSFRNKQRRFEILQEKNQNVKTNAVHISLNFGNPPMNPLFEYFSDPWIFVKRIQVCV